MKKHEKRGSIEQRSPLAGCVDFGLDAIARMIEAKGGEVDQIFVAVAVKGMSPDACTAGIGFEDNADLLAWLLLHTQQTAHQMGVPMQLHPLFRDS